MNNIFKNVLEAYQEGFISLGWILIGLEVVLVSLSLIMAPIILWSEGYYILSIVTGIIIWVPVLGGIYKHC